MVVIAGNMLDVTHVALQSHDETTSIVLARPVHVNNVVVVNDIIIEV